MSTPTALQPAILSRNSSTYSTIIYPRPEPEQRGCLIAKVHGSHLPSSLQIPDVRPYITPFYRRTRLTFTSRNAGEPVTFFVGPETNCRRFDIHHQLLCKSSSIFNLPTGYPRIITEPIDLPNTDSDAFGAIYQWLYEGVPPNLIYEGELQLLMEMWVVLAALGLKDKMNTIMRLDMALMQPKECTCSIETVKWVYDHTDPRSKLRGYIIAIFCQRGPALTAELFNTKGGIMKDAVKFFVTLNRVRAGNPKGIGGYDLPARFATARTFKPSAVPGSPGQFFATLVTGSEKIDLSKVVYPLPSFLVWGDQWQDLPDEHFFVKPDDESQEGGAVLSQLEKMR
ncbi:hypothetical protein CC86DRAFT_51466 [Ophiobolus disseminans]|uniref:BTB domain-containing protein n=1 Tax=Ophiobolus disseminans TaxID=1469910 RepID=A0A6A6ZTL0_9PLEO|nr:hypothetical protein CC86DRAFT_51466 [Ophiobolus disseminans]